MGIKLKSASMALNAISWCKKNISKQDYYIPHLHGVQAGGLGWEMKISGPDNAVLTFSDKQDATFFCLSFQNS